MEFCLIYLRQHKKAVFVFVLFCLIFASVFALYHLPVGAVFYPALLCAVLGSFFLIFDFYRAYRKYQFLMKLEKLPAAMIEELPRVGSLEDFGYQQIIRKLKEEQRQKEDRMNMRYSDMIDYYTVWVHQIKTPIASMRLNLQKEDSAFSRKISEDLFRIEQYVEMVLCYLRLDSDSTDYVIQEYDLDGIIKQAVRKLAGQFIGKKIRLVYSPPDVKVVTDEKWLLFVLEQVLSNALKYTESGSITIGLEEPETLYVRDTGIGIAPEDLPRIFEKGYTGYNGRSDKKASGLGLYLCRRICGNLGHTIDVDSTPGVGTTVRIRLEQKGKIVAKM